MLTAVYAMILQEFDNDELAAFNNAIQTWGRVHPVNLAYKKATGKELIKGSGEPHDLEAMRKASAYEVNRRAELGIFN